MPPDKPKSECLLRCVCSMLYTRSHVIVVLFVCSEELDRYKRDAERRLRAEAKAASRKHKSGGGSSKSGAAASKK